MRTRKIQFITQHFGQAKVPITLKIGTGCKYASVQFILASFNSSVVNSSHPLMENNIGK